MSISSRKFFTMLFIAFALLKARHGFAEEWHVAYLAADRPLEAVEEMRPVVKALQRQLHNKDVSVFFKSEVVRKRDGLDQLIRKKAVQLIRCESVYCMGLMQKFPELELLGIEAPVDKETETYHLVLLKDSEGQNQNIRQKNLLLGTPYSSGEDYLAKVELLRMGYSRNSFASLQYQKNAEKRMKALFDNEFQVTVLDDRTFQNYSIQLFELAHWESIPYAWLATSVLDKNSKDLLKEVMPSVPVKAFKNGLGQERVFLTKQLPDLLAITEAWHVSWLFDEGKETHTNN